LPLGGLVKRERVALAAILLSFVVLAASYSVLQPMWEAPDEPYHFGFIRYIQLHHALPRGSASAPAKIDEFDPTKEYSQVPLYYAILGVLLSPVQLPANAWFHANPYVMWPDHPWNVALALHRSDEQWPYHGMALFLHLARLVSVACGFITLVAIDAFLLTLTQRPAVALFGTALLAWTPGFLLASSRLNNDAGAMAFSALTLLWSARCLTRTAPSWRDLIALAVCLAGAVLSKIDTLVLVPLAGVAAYTAAATVVAWRETDPLTVAWHRRALVVAVTVLPAVGLLAGWWIAYGRTFPGRIGTQAGFEILPLAGAREAVDPKRVVDALATWNGTWWNGVGFGLAPGPWELYGTLATLLIILIAAGVVAILRGNWWKSRWGERGAVLRRATIFLCLTGVFLFSATITRQAFPWVNLDAHGRFTLPIAAVVVLLVALGGWALPLGRLRAPLAVALLGGVLVFAVASPVVLFPLLIRPTIPARLALNDQEQSGPALASFPNGVDLLAVEGLPPSLVPGDTLSLDLRWRDVRTPNQNFIAFIQLVRLPEQQRVTGLDAIPNEKGFPPLMWQSGEIIDEWRQLPIPTQLEPGTYGLKIGAYYQRQNVIEPIPALSPPASGGSILAGVWPILPDASDLQRARAVSARFGSALLLSGYRATWTNDSVQLALYWEAERPITQNLVVSAQLLDASGRLVGQHDGVPVAGRLPTPAWPEHRIVRDDHTVAIPNQPGLQATVVVYDQQTLQRLPVLVSGFPSADHLTLERKP
jgi:hypothetical protein